MTKRYSLSSDQQAQIKPILANQQQQMQALRQDSSLSREDKMAKMKSIREDSSSKIQALLNDSQKQKFAQDQERRQQQHAGAWSSCSRRTHSLVTTQASLDRIPASSNPGTCRGSATVTPADRVLASTPCPGIAPLLYR